MSNIYLVSYADREPYTTTQTNFNNTLNIAEIKEHTMWNKNKIRQETEFYSTNKTLLDKKIGSGLWIWKPYIILQKLKEVNYNDYVYYQDCSKYDTNGYKYSCKPVITFMESNNLVILPGLTPGNINKHHTSIYCMRFMGARNKTFLLKKLFHTSPLFIKKTDFTIKFIEEWLKYCCVPICIERFTWRNGSHCCDQSILNILLFRYNIKGLSFLTDKNNTKSHNFYLELFTNNIKLNNLSLM
jgi:hypothetical protein